MKPTPPGRVLSTDRLDNGLAAPYGGRRLLWNITPNRKRLSADYRVRLLDAAVAAAPDRLDLARDFARELYECERFADLVEKFGQSIRQANADPIRSDPIVLHYLGRAALAINQSSLAIDALQSARKIDRDLPQGYLAHALLTEGCIDAALIAAIDALEDSATDTIALYVAASVLLARAEPDRLWRLCDGVRKRGGWCGYLPSAMAIAATEPARVQEMARLVDASEWLSIKQLALPSSFNAELAEEILSHRRLVALSPTKATVGTGRRISDLQAAPGPCTEALLAHIREAVDTYVAERAKHAKHPLIARLPSRPQLESWSVVVQNDGHEEWHLHPRGWISGVYYPRVPIVSTGASDGGAIEFGPYPFGQDTRHSASWPARRVNPSAGMLLIFPSYFGHHTWPTEVSDPRICVAFDVS